MEGKIMVALTGIIGVVAICLMMLYKDINGTLAVAIVGSICTIVGLAFGIKIGGQRVSSNHKTPS